MFFDELSSAPPAVQAALLRVVLERRVGSLALPPPVRVVAAANPPSSAADGWHLSPPLANRFVHLDWTHDPRTVARGMAGTWPSVTVPLVDPAKAPRAVARARGAISGFLFARPGLAHHLPGDAESRGRAWPSPRTWEMALRLLATGYAAAASAEAIAAALTGAVGDGAGIELVAYLERLDLPDPDRVLADPDAFALPTRGDRQLAFLIADGLALPADPVEPRTFGLPAGRLFEEYLPRIPSQAGMHDCGSGAHGHPADWEADDAGGPGGVSPVEAEAIRRHTAEAMRAHQRGRGTLPAGWKRWADQALEPTIDWRRVLAGAVREAVTWAAGAADYTYRRPSRRSAALRGVVLPSLRRPLPAVAVVIDTSGSMGSDDLAMALAEVTGVLREVGVAGNRVAVLACDADVHTASRVTSAQQITLAGGGTDMRVGIERALALPERPGVVIVLTDGHTPWPGEPSSCRLIAILTSPDSPSPPAWAETVRITR